MRVQSVPSWLQNAWPTPSTKIGFDNQAFALAVACQHRTLQQSMMRAFVAVSNQLASHYAEGGYDLRNEAACKLAVEISKLESGLPFI